MKSYRSIRKRRCLRSAAHRVFHSHPRFAAIIACSKIHGAGRIVAASTYGSVGRGRRADARQELKLNEDMCCEVWVRGPNVFTGYPNKLEQIAMAFDAEGFSSQATLCSLLILLAQILA